ncbi:PAF acetylhydrolase [Plectosphaerella cucumerina]|uniref:1-alkyl-2-acetylglycerophosphocholine esterase n=1 Tax=Plectosphaerella cucumerina TaxID=40658 RepID=A0A8K0WZG2_9PEZI|nr:PAF acetylhydrolase [Plectosphaerella cucumerina]
MSTSLQIILGGLALAANAIILPPPSGPFDVSMSISALTDASRLDPYAPANAPHDRRVMISTFLPVEPSLCGSRDVVPYMTPLNAAVYDEAAVAFGLPNGTFASLKLDNCVPKKQTPCKPANATTVPLILFSPGWGNPRLLHSLMAKEIASRGFAVVTIDHSYDPSFIEFPDGTVYRGVELDAENSTQLEELVQVRAQDASFVLTHLHENAVVGINLDKTIMMGHSLGGASSAAAMLSDRRILGGMNIDGMMFDPVLDAGLDKPFALVGAKPRDDPTWDTFYDASRGQKSELAVEGTKHGSFTDIPVLLKALNVTLPAEVQTVLEGELGTIPFGRTSQVVAGIVESFAGLVFEGKVGGVFGAGDAALPEVSVVRSGL